MLDDKGNALARLNDVLASFAPCFWAISLRLNPEERLSRLRDVIRMLSAGSAELPELSTPPTATCDRVFAYIAISLISDGACVIFVRPARILSAVARVGVVGHLLPPHTSVCIVPEIDRARRIFSAYAVVLLSYDNSDVQHCFRGSSC